MSRRRRKKGFDFSQFIQSGDQNLLKEAAKKKLKKKLKEEKVKVFSAKDTASSFEVAAAKKHKSMAQKIVRAVEKDKLPIKFPDQEMGLLRAVAYGQFNLLIDQREWLEGLYEHLDSFAKWWTETNVEET